MLKYSSFISTIKYEIPPQAPKLLLKNVTFFSPSIKISRKNINLEDKKRKKSYFYKNKKVLKVDGQTTFMLTKYYFQKKNHVLQISQLNISLNIMMMMLLDLYI